MRKTRLLLWLLSALSALLLSLPWLIPHAGLLALVAFVPLLVADAVAEQCKVRASWLFPFFTFLAWNAATTFWVWNATAGGAVFAIVANALQMLLIWLLFRLARKKMQGALPYIFLAAMWMAFERRYFDVDFSWPWLTLGGAFARSTRLIQWYEFTGTLGGSLWIWVVNLGVYGLLVAVFDGFWSRWRGIARVCAVLGLTVAVAGPLVGSKLIYDAYEERSEGTVDVLIGQPNLDPYQKFQSMTQAQQTEVLLDEFARALPDTLRKPLLLLAPETFTGDIVLNDPERSATVRAFRAFLAAHPGAELLFGASTYDIFETRSAPSILSRPYGDGWIVSHNSALMARPEGPLEYCHKSKLVIGVEMTPWPKIFVPLDDWLSRKMGVSGLIGRSVGQDHISLLHFGEQRIPLGCAVC